MTTNQPSFPIYLPEIWAKSSEDRQTDGESLEEHSWHTVSRMRDLVLLRPDLPKIVGDERLWQRLFWACLMHDFGKVASGFQKMLRKGGNWGLRHEVLSLASSPLAQGHGGRVATGGCGTRCFRWPSWTGCSPLAARIVCGLWQQLLLTTAT